MGRRREREREREGRKEGGRANERERPLFASSTFCLPPSFPSSLSPSLLPSAIGTPTARRSTAVRPTADSTNPLKNATKRPQFLKSSGALSLSLYTFSPYSRSCSSPSLSRFLPSFHSLSILPRVFMNFEFRYRGRQAGRGRDPISFPQNFHSTSKDSFFLSQDSKWGRTLCPACKDLAA